MRVAGICGAVLAAFLGALLPSTSAGPMPIDAPVDCELSVWSAYGACALPACPPELADTCFCKKAVQGRTRTVVTAPVGAGLPCGPLSLTRRCHLTPVDCVVTEWTAWSTCAGSCGYSSQSRTRSVTTPASNGGTACPAEGDLSQTQPCNQFQRPVDCVLSEWTEWSDDPCTRSCGGGTQIRYKGVTLEVPMADKRALQDRRVIKNHQVCNVFPCP
eukprot:m.219986 g.219986  ORF g.219986 m.219986 type:complete len:216 (+) comp54142_c0_seq13:800-1447(+)